jgi:hypothetical protein
VQRPDSSRAVSGDPGYTSGYSLDTPSCQAPTSLEEIRGGGCESRLSGPWRHLVGAPERTYMLLDVGGCWSQVPDWGPGHRSAGPPTPDCCHGVPVDFAIAISGIGADREAPDLDRERGAAGDLDHPRRASRVRVRPKNARAGRTRVIPPKTAAGNPLPRGACDPDRGLRVWLRIRLCRDYRRRGHYLVRGRVRRLRLGRCWSECECCDDERGCAG